MRWDPWVRALGESVPLEGVLNGTEDLLVLAAHPDDEAIGAGRLVAAHAGRRRCITLTAGEWCFGGDVDPEAVRTRRLAEWDAAIAALGAEAVDTPRFPDGTLADHVDDAVAALAGVAGSADVILAPWEGDPHPDHAAAGRIAAALSAATGARVLSYVVWAPYWLRPDDVARLGARAVLVATPPHVDAVWRDAIAQHRSQVEPEPPASKAVVPVDLLDRHARQILMTSP